MCVSVSVCLYVVYCEMCCSNFFISIVLCFVREKELRNKQLSVMQCVK